MADDKTEETNVPTELVAAPVAEPEAVAPVSDAAPVEPIEGTLPAETKPIKGKSGRPRKIEAEAGPSSTGTPEPVLAAEAPAAAESSLTIKPDPKAKPRKLQVKPAPRAVAPKIADAAPKASPVARKQVAKVPSKAAATRTNRVTPAAVATKRSAPASRKELFAMTTANEFTEKFQTSFKDASEKAKAAFGDMGEFTKGNVEAMVQSSKILATGLQEMGKSYVSESKSAMETMTAEIKGLTSVKSPTEFFEKQSALLRKQFDAAVAASSKNSEAMLKLANEAFQPISTRVSLAVEKIKQAA